MKLWKKLTTRVHPKVRPTSAAGVDFETHIKEEDSQDQDGECPGRVDSVQAKLRFHGTEHPSLSGHHKAINFHDIVDTDERSLEHRFSHDFVGWLVESLPFRMILLVAILLDSLTIGIQTDRYLEENYGSVFMALDKFFLTVFIMEILIKWYHDFFGFWKVNWNIFDFIIVAASLLGPSLTFLSISRVLPILRVLRALRSLRSISALRGLQIVVQTVIHSIPDMANIFALLLICMYIFAILGYSFFGENCPKHFGSLGTSMFSLFICVTQDGWMSITNELNSCGNSILGAIYLVIFITIGAFVFANLVVAVVVTNLEWAIAEQKDVEEKQKHGKNSTKDADFVTINADEALAKLAKHQQPLEIPEFNLETKTLENYFLILSAIEDNLVEFKKIQEQLAEIVQEIKALMTLDDVSDDEVFELSAMTAGPSHIPSSSTGRTASISDPEPRRRRFNSMSAGDAVSNLISMNRHYPINKARAKSIHHVITHLANSSQQHHVAHMPSNPSFRTTGGGRSAASRASFIN